VPALPDLDRRATVHAALGDPVRLSIVDELHLSDRSPVELRRRLDIESNLLAHHLDVLEEAGLVERSRSSGDGRRRYVHLRHDALGSISTHPTAPRRPALFVCSANSARSQLAAALWTALTGEPGASAGTEPAAAVAPGAVAAARRAGLDLSAARPRPLSEVPELPGLVVTVCDRAHEQLDPGDGWLHWSVPDPVAAGTAEAFDATVAELRARIAATIDLAAAS
jgi:protein-tyrosine-phosphatase/DNA-binding transcriptional ArsR family regulator